MCFVCFRLRRCDWAALRDSLPKCPRQKWHSSYSQTLGLHCPQSWRNLSPSPCWVFTECTAQGRGTHTCICCWQLSASTPFSSQRSLNGVCNPPSHPLSSLPRAGMLASALCHLSESIFLSLAYMGKSAHCHVTPQLLKTAPAPTLNLGLKQCPPPKET